RAMPAARGELPTLLGIGHDLMVPPVPRPEPSHVAVPAMRSRLRSHEAIEEVIAPVFDAAPDGVIKRRRHNPAHLHADLEKSPRDVELLRELLASLGRAADHDRRFRIAQVLVFLGEARDEERALYEKHAEGGLARPRRALEDEEWTELLFHPEEDRLTGRILAAIAPAVMLGQMGAIRASLAPEVVDPSREVDPHGSTLQAVRCLNWAAAILGLDTPPVYVCPDHPGTIDVVLNPRPVTRLGKLALSGRRSRELAFSAGRHLSWFRKEHLLGRPRGSVRRLEDMFLAALLMGNPGLPITGEVKKRVAPIAAAIFPLLDASAVEGLKREFGRFVAEGGRTKLGRWLRGAERTGDRAGMLLTNDLWAAEHMLKLEEPERATTAIDELIGFVTSETYGTLRRRIGIALPSND
ncbi:MAG: hypothetical protein KC731_31055, partial [Myxococcales bacterium]|nr:hypothetical protein [Myxococcales bacterium]